LSYHGNNVLYERDLLSYHGDNVEFGRDLVLPW